MKRSLMMTALSVVLSLQILGVMSCTVAPNGNNSAVTNGNTNATAATNSNTNSSATTGNAATADAITAKEKQVWDALKNKNHEAFGNMLATDFVYVSGDGVADKAGTVNGLKEFAPTEITLSDWKTVVLDEDAAVVTYTVDAKGTAGGQPIPPGAQRASTAWVKRGAEWVAVYHQDCPIKTAETAKPAGSTANANANANTNANTAAKPAATAAVTTAAADDPVASEKQMWDALKRKDWDTFAANLAAEQVEVEPDGVFDRAGTLAGVKEADFSKLTVSDYKATKLDDDATLVTYMVRGQTPDGKSAEHRASTIWVKRDGKWSAFFHHGTPVMKMAAK